MVIDREDVEEVLKHKWEEIKNSVRLAFVLSYWKASTASSLLPIATSLSFQVPQLVYPHATVL